MSEWWRGGVIYQIYPRSFQDTNGDGIGDLPGITERLGHVASLGADAIWLSPFFTSPMADMGYDVSNYREVDPIFGTLRDFDALVQRAHGLGLKVIIDQVLSHTSDRHPWFEESKMSRTNPRADWYVWAEPKPDGSPPNNWPSVFGGSAWEWNGTRRQYYLHNFLTSQPDLNFHNPEVQDAMLGVLRFWLERGVDGFRFDTVNYYFHDHRLRDNPAADIEEETPLEIDPYGMQWHVFSKNRRENLGFLRRIRSLMDEFPDTTTVGEVGEAHMALKLMADYTTGTDKLHMCYSFDMLGPIFTASHFRSRIEGFFEAAPDGWPCWSFSNHDVNRHVTRWAKHARDAGALARQCIALLLSLKGSVCIYQGEELGLPEAELAYEELTDPPGLRFWPANKGRDGCRTPMPWDEGSAPNGFSTGKPWLPVKPPHSALNVASQEKEPASTLHYYREILKWRKEHPALVTGGINFFDTAEPVLAFSRTTDQETVTCVFNLSRDEIAVTLECGAKLTPAPVSEGADNKAGTLALAPNGFAFFVQDAGVQPIGVSYPAAKR